MSEGPEIVVTADLFKSALELARDVIDSRAKLLDFMDAASESLRTKDNPYRIAAIIESTTRTVRVANTEQRDRVENLIAVAAEHTRTG